MIYYTDDELVIRDMEEADSQILYDEYIAQGWRKDVSQELTSLKDQAEGKCIALLAVYQGHPAGAVYVYMTVPNGPFQEDGYPSIAAFGVLKKYQKKGIGTRLLDVAEQIAGQYADKVCLSVGLRELNGGTHMVYQDRGYIWYHSSPCPELYTECVTDDDLTFYMYKDL